jgi:hypothetical protein
MTLLDQLNQLATEDQLTSVNDLISVGYVLDKFIENAASQVLIVLSDADYLVVIYPDNKRVVNSDHSFDYLMDF